MEDIYISVPETGAGLRLDRFLAEVKPEITRSRYQRLIENKQVLLSSLPVKSGHKLKGGEIISIHLPKPELSVLEPEEISLDIVYEDSSVIVINKPAGMVVHPGAGNRTGTLVNALLSHCKDLKGVGGVERPGIVHRLDKFTSGLMVVAKNDFSHASLSTQLKERTVSRRYLAIAKNRMKELSGTISEPIGRHPVNRKKMSVNSRRGRKARTHFRVLSRSDHNTLLELRLDTGRTHQIRVHLASAGHPILGDEVYGRGNLTPFIKRQALHAAGLEFLHPETGRRLTLSCEIPEDFRYCMKMVGIDTKY